MPCSAGGGDYLSGQELSRTLGISRAAVWKAVEALRRQGYDIEARTGRGYRLVGAPDLLSRETVERYLSRPREDFRVLETVDSTNSFCRRLALEGPLTARRCWRIARRLAEGAGPQLPVPGRQGPVFLHPLAARLRPGEALTADGSQRRGCLPCRSAGDRCSAADQVAQ